MQKLFLSLFCIIIFHTSVSAQEKKDVTAPETPKEIKLEKKLQKKIYSIPQFFHETLLFVKQPTKWVGKDWLKIPTEIRQEFVIGGWTESESGSAFRSLLFGYYKDGKLIFQGHAGGGFK